MRRIATRFALAATLVLVFALVLKSSVFHVPTGTWSSAANMSSARSSAIAVLVPDGRVVFAGGNDAGGQPLATAEAFGSDGSFAPLPSMTAARSGHAAIYTMNGDLLVTGGVTSGGGITNSAEVFDSLTNSWHALPSSLLEARKGHTMSQLQDGNILVAGGENSGGPVSALEIYDLTSGTFRSAGALIAARKGHGAAVLNDGRVLIAGGTSVQPDGTATTLASTEIYDPATGTVTAGPALATPRTGATATILLDGRVLIAGGSNPEGATDGVAELASAEIFDPTSGTITASASQMSSPRTGHIAILLPNNNSVLIAGGTSAGTDLASAELYVPWNDAFQPTASMSAARSAASGSAMGNGTYIGVDGLAVVAGGNNHASADVYGFATVKTDKPDYWPGEVVTISGFGWQPGETVSLILHEVNGNDADLILKSVADSNGIISNAQFSPDALDFKIQFALTARGSYSEAQIFFTDGASNVNFAATGLPDGAVVAVTYSGTNNGGHTLNGSTSLTVPNNSVSVGTLSGSQFSYLFQESVVVSGQTYNFVSGSPSSPFTTPNPSSGPAPTTTVTGNYVLACTAPTISTQPTVTSKTVGDSVTFSVVASGTAPLTYQWRKNGTPISGATADSYSIGSVLVSDAGTYDVVVTGPCSPAATSTGATLTVNKATPAFSNLTTSQSITYGTPSVSLSGTLASGSLIPTGSVSATINGVTQPATFNSSTGAFSATFDTHTIPAAPSVPYTITYNFTPDSTSSTNFTTASDSSTALTVNKASAKITVDAYSAPYDGNAHTATGSTIGADGETLTGLDLTGTTHTNAGDYPSDAWTFTDSTGNYNNANGTVHDAIVKATSTTVVTFESGPYTYRGTAFTATAQVTGVGGLSDNVTPVTYTGDCTNVTAANGCTATATYAGDTNHETSTDTKSITIEKANATIKVTPYSVTYDGNSHTATGTVTGVKGEALSGLVLSGTTHTNAGTYATDPWTFTDSTGNYNNASGSASDEIAKAPVTATAGGGTSTYDGSAKSPSACVVSGSYTGDLACTNSPAFVGPNAGTSAIDVVMSGTGLGNFEVKQVTGSYTISQKAASVTPNAASKIFGQADPVFTGTLNGFLASDNVTATYSRTAGETVGTYSIGATLSPEAVLTNYAITYNTATFTINPWTLSGFYQPVSMSPTGMIVWNTVKGGSTVPFKFNIYAGSIQKTSPTDVQNSSIAVYIVSCAAGVDDPTDVFTNTGGTLLRYDSIAGQFIQNWQTPKGQACYAAVMTANDGSHLTAYFKTK